MSSKRDTMLAALRARAEAVLLPAPGGARRWAHSERVHGLGRHLARQTGAERFIVGAAALLHAWPDEGGQSPRSRIEAELAALAVPQAIAASILAAIAALDGDAPAGANDEATTLWEADRLDALGAIGIAELLLDGGASGAPLHERDDPFALLRPLDPDRSLLDRLYVHLSTIPHRMHSSAARQIAIRRSGIMLFYLESLRDELAETIPDALLPEQDWLVPKEGTPPADI
jgi:uncharacterized protein